MQEGSTDQLGAYCKGRDREPTFMYMKHPRESAFLKDLINASKTHLTAVRMRNPLMPHHFHLPIEFQVQDTYLNAIKLSIGALRKGCLAVLVVVAVTSE